ncbi:MAG: glycosyltransferase [Vibrio sp.]|uniref:glycosyltransferase n=1 Tax=Vibrio sp. TaxID=678 RepID=UPI003A8523C1
MTVSYKTCGLVIWFNPKEQEVENLSQHLKYFDDFVIVDNSDIDNKILLDRIGTDCRIKYIPLLNNEGIAYALNIGCQSAIDMKYDWILTLDQDSYFDVGQLDKYFCCIQSKLDDSSIAVFSSSRKEDVKEGYQSLVITSGNILSLKAYKDVSGFDNALFIDEVDFDMCFKLQKYGYKIFQFKDVILNHNLGENYNERMLFNKKVRVMNHSPLRKYYIFRNRLVIRSRYPQYRELYTRSVILFFLTTLFFERKKLVS